jgi:hypothetical protein
MRKACENAGFPVSIEERGEWGVLNFPNRETDRLANAAQCSRRKAIGKVPPEVTIKFFL